MATLYWGGGTGTWTTTATNWYTDVARTIASAAAPTSVDDVIFDSASNATAYTVTISTSATCRNWTASGPASGNVTFTGTAAMSIYGSVSWTATGITSTYIGNYTLANVGGASGTNTLNFNGLTFGGSPTVGSAATNTVVWQLTGNFAITGSLTIRSGTFDTNGFNTTVPGSWTSSTTTYVRAIYLRTGTHTFGSGISAGTCFSIASTNLTFDAGTSNLIANLNPANGIALVFTGTFTVYNLTIAARFTSISTTSLTVSNNFSLTGLPSIGSYFDLVGDLTVNGTLSFQSATPANRYTRLLFRNQGIGDVKSTLSAAALANFVNIDFKNITATGTAIWSGTSIGDCGGNTGITFDSPKTVYWGTAAGGNWAGVNWASSPGGAVSDTNYPLPQDTVAIVDTGLNSGATITLPSLHTAMGTFDASARSLGFTVTGGTSTTMYCSGDFKIGTANVGGSTSWSLLFWGNSTQTISSAGGYFTISSSITFDILKPSTSTLTFGTNFQLGTSATPNSLISLRQGILDLNSKNITCSIFTATTTYVKSISTGGNIYINGYSATVLQILSATTISAQVNFYLTTVGLTGTRALNQSSTGPILPNVYVTNSSDTITYSSAFYCNDLNFTGFTGTWDPGATGGAIYGNLTFGSGMLTSTTTTSVNYINSTAGTSRTIDTKGVIINFPLNLSGATLGTQTWEFASAFTGTNQLSLSNGVLNTNGYSISIRDFVILGTATKTVNLGSSTVTLNASATLSNWNMGTGTGLTVNAGTSSIIVIQTTLNATTTFAGAGRTYNRVYFQGSVSGVLSITGANTINYFENQKTAQSTIQLAASSTHTFGTLKLNGARGREVIFRSPSTIAATIAKSGGGISENNFLLISYINASTTNTFYAGLNSTSVAGTNTNWVFNYFTKPKVGNALGFFQ